MLWRFSLYGLLKNQRYFEAFLVLAFVERGLGFAEIGAMIALRELTTNLLEIPSGVMADLLGRRRTMVAAFAAYVVAYLVLGLTSSPLAIALGMLLIGTGDAFRSGTHKAMIFDWLAAAGRQDERVKVYGYTRSWSQVGSALAVPVAAAVVFFAGSYAHVFWLSAIPAALNLLNLATYPRALEGPRQAHTTIRDTARSLWSAARALWPRRSLRRLLLEAIGISGSYKATKDYLQPLLEGLALSVPLLLSHAPVARSAVLVGVVYVVLFALSAVAARRAHRLVERLGGVEPGARVIRLAVVGVFAGMLAGLVLGASVVAVVAFVALALVHNLFRPVLVARFNDHAPAELNATVLSVESQATSLGAVVLAPAVGLAIDAVSTPAHVELWPLAAVGLGLALLVAGLGSGARSGTGSRPGSESGSSAEDRSGDST